MAETLNKVKVNKISKERYDTLVESGVITPQMIKEEVWLFNDDQFVSAHDKEVWNSKPGEGAIPTKLSQLTNDTGFITKNVNNLTYYTKTNDLPPVARTGQYSDLSGIPEPITLVSQLENDVGYITEEDIPHIPEYTSELTNDSGYITDVEVNTKLNDYQPLLISGTNIKTINNSSLLGSGNIDIAGGGGTWGTIGGTLSDQTDLQNALDAKQDTLVSGTNIKTIDNNSLLGNGNLDLRLDNMPVGYVYISTDSTSPAQLFGGTWTQINDRFLYAVNIQSASKQTAGSNTNDHTHTSYGVWHAHGLGSGYAQINHNGGNMRFAEKGGVDYWDTGRAAASGASESVWQDTGVYLGGTTDGTTPGNSTTSGASDTNNMPAYFTVYAWHRIA